MQEQRFASSGLEFQKSVDSSVYARLKAYYICIEFEKKLINTPKTEKYSFVDCRIIIVSQMTFLRKNDSSLELFHCGFFSFELVKF